MSPSHLSRVPRVKELICPHRPQLDQDPTGELHLLQAAQPYDPSQPGFEAPDENHAEQIQPVDALQPRRRGRRRKSPNENAAESIDYPPAAFPEPFSYGSQDADYPLQESSVREDAQDPPVSGPRKRGRKPKDTSKSLPGNFRSALASDPANANGSVGPNPYPMSGPAGVENDDDGAELAGDENSHNVSRPGKRKRRSEGDAQAQQDKRSRTGGAGVNLNHKFTLPSSGAFVREEEQEIDKFANNFREAHDLSPGDFNNIVQDKDRGAGALIKDFWKDAYTILPNRNAKAMQRHLRRRFHNFESRGKWTAQEDRELAEEHEKHPGKWTVIGDALGRMPEDCRDRWRNYGSCGAKRNIAGWTEKEELHLSEAVAECKQEIYDQQKNNSRERGFAFKEDQDWESKINFNAVSAKMGHSRSRLQCLQHWKKMNARDQLAQQKARSKGRSAQNSDHKPTWRGEQSLKRYEKMLVGDKIDLLYEILNSDTFSEDRIPWSLITQRSQDSRWTTADRKVAWENMKQDIEEHDSLKGHVEALVQHYAQSFPDQIEEHYSGPLNEGTGRRPGRPRKHPLPEDGGPPRRRRPKQDSANGDAKSNPNRPRRKYTKRKQKSAPTVQSENELDHGVDDQPASASGHNVEEESSQNVVTEAGNSLISLSQQSLRQSYSNGTLQHRQLPQQMGNDADSTQALDPRLSGATQFSRGNDMSSTHNPSDAEMSNDISAPVAQMTARLPVASTARMIPHSRADYGTDMGEPNLLPANQANRQAAAAVVALERASRSRTPRAPLQHGQTPASILEVGESPEIKNESSSPARESAIGQESEEVEEGDGLAGSDEVGEESSDFESDSDDSSEQDEIEEHEPDEEMQDEEPE